MKILKVFKSEKDIEEYRIGERSQVLPQEFVKDIIYKDGVFTIWFSDDKEWFKSFIGFHYEYTEFNEIKNRSNKDKLQ